MFKNKYQLRFLQNKSAENSDVTQPENAENQTGDTSTENEGDSKLFTQDEVNRVVSKRVKEVRKQFGDYEEIKSKVEKFQSELEQLKTQNKQLASQYESEVYTSNLRESARELNLEYALAAKHIDKEKIIFVDGKPTNLKELLQSEIEKFPQLIRKMVSTPEIAQSKTDNQPKFSLHKKSNSTFFNGGGMRPNVFAKDSN